MKTLTALFGSWPRVITTITVSVNAVLFFMLPILLLGERASTFRLEADTDLATYTTLAPTRWAESAIRAREGDAALCPRAPIEAPAGVEVEARKHSEGASVSLLTPAGIDPIVVFCPSGKRTVQFVEIWTPTRRLALEGSRPVGRADFATGVTLMLDQPTPSVLAITGTALRVGGTPDADSPIEQVPLLWRGVLSSETRSWPIESTSEIAERVLQPGDIVTFDQPPENGRPGKAVPFTGLLLVSGERLRVVARAEAEAAYVTAAGADEGRPAVVAPTLAQRLQSQAEWGVIILMGALVLNILGAFRARFSEQEELFKWTRRRPSRRPNVLLMAGAVAGALTIGQDARAQSPGDPPMFYVVGPNGPGQAFAILNPRSPPKCLLITAAHVAPPGEIVELVGNSIDRPTGGKLQARAKYIDLLAPGLAVLAPMDNADLAVCPPLTALNRQVADAALDPETLGRVRFAEPNGLQRSALASMVDAPLATSFSVVGVGAQIGTGLSGSAYVARRTLLGVVMEVTNGVANIARLDGMALNALYVSTAAQVATKPRWKDFDVEKLPKAYRDAVLSARAVRDQAVTSQNVAVDNARRADAAAQQADARIPGYRTIALSKGARLFSGQVDENGVVVGYGVLKVNEGDEIGDAYRGFYVQEGTSVLLKGAGTHTIGNPKRKGQVKFEATFNGNVDGYGALTFSSGDVLWTRWAAGQPEGPAVQLRQSDGALVEGVMKDGFFTGPGVMWSKDGQPICICVWTKNVATTNETDTIVSGTK